MSQCTAAGYSYGVDEINDTMTGLEVDHRPEFLRGMAKTCCEGRSELDEADFMLVVSLTKHIVKVGTCSAFSQADTWTDYLYEQTV